MKEKYTLFMHLAIRGCDTLLNLLNKAETFTKENNLEESEILNAKIAPDMFDFKRQVQVYTDMVLGGAYRLVQLEKPSLPDTEQTFVELVARVQNVKDLLGKIDIESANNIHDIKIALPWMGGMYFEGPEFLQNFAFMNSFFHLTTAYNILRMKGVVLSKPDFLGKLEMKRD
jgi:hypothetical protein